MGVGRDERDRALAEEPPCDALGRLAVISQHRRPVQAQRPPTRGEPNGRRSGVASSALRFYERRGLISSERAGSGHRRYPRPVLRRIAFIIFAQRIGLTLEEIGVELARLPPHQAPTRRDWSRLSATWTSRIDERIAELERLNLGLTECIGCGCLSLDRCKLANPDDRAAWLGPGPRYWIGDRLPG
jgi:MerR family redox-sensitive transcriptional activator SoxR